MKNIKEVLGDLEKVYPKTAKLFRKRISRLLETVPRESKEIEEWLKKAKV